MAYTNEEDMLMLSGIQHYVFCPRQWALIHIEQQWEENILTIEGKILHEHADDPSYRIKNREKLTLRRVAIASKSLGLHGFSDIIELQPTDSSINSIRHPKYPGFWFPIPVEYKRGKCKPTRCDEVQVAAQVICLEEMYNIQIPKGMIYYNEERGRQEVIVDTELRKFTQHCADSMHQLFHIGNTPSAEFSKQCLRCSLHDLCMPEIKTKQKAQEYLSKNLYEETT